MSDDIQNATQSILNAIDKLQNDLYLKIKLYEKYMLWSSFFIYGSDIKECNGDLDGDPRCSEDYGNYIRQYGVEPQNYIAYITKINQHQMAFNVMNLKDIAMYIKSMTDPSGKISIQDNAEKNKVIDTFGEYLGAIIYFNKVDYFIEEFNNFTGNFLASNQGAYFEALFGDTSGLSNRQSLYQQQINTQLKLLNQQVTTQKDIQKLGGVFIRDVSYAPTILIQEYNQASLEYREGFKQLYDVLKSVPELQMCLSNVNVGDIQMNDISNSDITINCEAISKCISNTLNNVDQDEKKETDEKEPEKPEETIKENSNKKNKWIIIVIIIIILLMVICGVSLIIIFKKPNQKNNI